VSSIRFFVAGIPQSAGSKRAFAIRKGGILTGRVAVSDANPKAKSWKNAVASRAAEVLQGSPIITGPIRLTIEFRLPRPKGHYGTGKNAGKLRESCPKYPTARPDSTKLLRCAEDAMTEIAWADDAQIVEQLVIKTYSDKPGAWIEIEELL